MKPIEAVARVLYEAEFEGDFAALNPRGIKRAMYMQNAGRAIAALADNISDEACDAAMAAWNAKVDVLDDDLVRPPMRRALSAAIRALGKE